MKMQTMNISSMEMTSAHPHETWISKPLWFANICGAIQLLSSSTMKPVPGNPDRVLCADFCLCQEGYGEIIGGSKREEDYDALCSEDGITWVWISYRTRTYLDLRKYGTVPHGGFGIGI